MPPNDAARFSRKAEIPSRASAVREMSAMARDSCSIWVSNVSVQPPCSSRLEVPSAFVGPAASRSASSAASSMRSSSGTTRVMMPHSKASRADSSRPVMASSIVRLRPTPAGPGALNRRYHRRVHARHTRDSAVQVGGELLEETGQIFALLGEILQVAADAERISRTGEHHRPDAGVLVAAQRGLEQLPAHLQVDGVARPWPVEGNVGDAVANFELQRIIRHSVLPP